ncbi:MAG: hypothetical protein HXS54_02230 [Theionarchaea archaeon]|nr:hypothetical protein [Theionarchaea archaeon]
MNFKKIVVVMGCCLVMLVIPVPLKTGGGPVVWSYQITRLSSSALSDDGERFLIGCDNGEYFVFDRYGNLKIHSVDIAENGNMIFGLENGVVFIDEHGSMLSKEYFIGYVLHVSMARDGSYAVAGTNKEIFLMSPKGLRWKAEIIVEDSQGNPSDKRGTSAVDQAEVTISKVAISEQGSTIAVAAQEKVFLFGSESERLKARIDMGFKITSLVILPDESGVAIGTEGGTLSLYTTEGIREFSIPQQGVPTSKALQGSISSMAASSEHILVGTSEGKIYLFDREGNVLQEKDTFGNENFGSIRACDISDDGKVMIVLDLKGNVSFFNTSTGIGWKFKIRDPLFAELSENGKYGGITGKNSIHFLDNWENTHDGTGFFPYTSRGSFSLENDLYKVWSYPVTGSCVFDYGDINGDGQNEVVLGSGTELVVLNYQGKLMWKISFPSPVEVVWLHDVTEDAVPEIFVGLDNGQLNMEVWSGEGKQLASFNFMGEFRVKSHPEEIGMEPIMAMDIDHDGIIEIISSVRIDYQGRSGGILVFEYPSGEIQWSYPIAPFQTSYVLTDINNDDNLELVLGSRSLCRGTAVEKRDDCHLYTMVVDLEGKEIWVKEIENVSGFMELLVAVSDFDGDGRKEIAGTVGSLDNTYGKLFILNSKGDYTYEREFSHSVWFGGIADFEKDGLKEIVVSDSEGRVVMYDHKLIPLKQFEVGEITTPYVKAIADLDGNGILEIVFVTDNGKFIVLDSSLAEIVSLKFDKKPEVIVANVSGCALDLLVSSSDKVELYSLKRERSNACPLRKESFLEYPEIYFEKAGNHYINFNFRGAGEYYNTAKTLYEKAGNIDMAIESTRMLERTENFCNALSKVESGRKKITHIDFKEARYDSNEKVILFDVSLDDKNTRYGFIEEEILDSLVSEDEDTIKAEEWIKTARNDFSEAKILFERLLENEEYNEVKEWLHIYIVECENSLQECDDLGKAFEGFLNGKKEFERQNFGSAEEYFTSALQIFEKYEFDQLIQQSHSFLRKIEEYQTAEESRKGIVVLLVGLCAGAVIFGLIYGSWKLLQDTMYRNENHSTFDSLLYTFHIKGFPKFSVIKNPYYAGKPVRDPSMFFGREPLYEFLESNLVSPGQSPSIIFYGERKTGKTSILFQIESGKLNLGPEFIPVYIDMNKMVIRDDYEFLSNVVFQIQRIIEIHQIQVPMIPLEKKRNPHLYFKDTFLREIADSVGKKRILFLVDEYEVIEKKVSGGKLSREILSYLKSVIEPEVKLDFIFTGSKKVEDLKYFDEWSYTLGASVSRKISFLREKDAMKLIKDPVAEKVWYTNRAVRKLLEFTGCHPYFIQHVCFNLVALLNENESFAIDIKEVEEVIQDIVDNPMPQVEYLWRRLSKDQKELVSFLAKEIQEPGDSMSWWRIIDEFKEKKIGLPRNESAILNDLEKLKEKDILKSVKHEYSFCADIFRQFVAEHYPPQRVF